MEDTDNVTSLPVDAQSPVENAEAVELAAQVAALTAERDELNDRLLRRQAEFENYKKRTDRERCDFVQSTRRWIAPPPKMPPMAPYSKSISGGIISGESSCGPPWSK
jgi:hypothetical protein